MSNRIHATYVSVWDNGIEIETPAVFDRETGVRDEVQMAQFSEGMLESLDIRTGEYIRYDGRQYELRGTDDGTYHAIRPCGVLFSRCGYARVMATSWEEAMRIADKKLTCDDVSWYDDWPATASRLRTEEAATCGCTITTGTFSP